MATRTPTKINSTIESKYSVIPLPQSPSQTSINLTGLPRVAKDIAADVYNTIQKWNDSHIQGAALVKKIINLKCDGKKKYPEGLEKLIEELEEIVHRLSLQANSLTFLSKQISSLSRLHRQQRLFATLSAEELSNLVNTVAKAYQLELKVKKYVFENIGHSKNETEAMFHGASWAHQQYVTNKISTLLEIILTETGHRQIY